MFVPQRLGNVSFHSPLKALFSVKGLQGGCGGGIKPRVTWLRVPHHLSSRCSSQTTAGCWFCDQGNSGKGAAHLKVVLEIGCPFPFRGLLGGHFDLGYSTRDQGCSFLHLTMG